MTLDPARSAPDATGLPPGDDDVRRVERHQWSCRRRLERKLHDGPALRISALTLQLGLFRHRLPAEDTALHESVDGVQDELAAVLQELREVASALYPPLLDEAGLGPALREQTGRMDAPVVISASEDRFGAAAEGAAYFAVVACLTAQPPAHPVEVVVRGTDGALEVCVDGVDPRHVDLFRDGAHPLGGTVTVGTGTRPGTGTITARYPCE